MHTFNFCYHVYQFRSAKSYIVYSLRTLTVLKSSRLCLCRDLGPVSNPANTYISLVKALKVGRHSQSDLSSAKSLLSPQSHATRMAARIQADQVLKVAAPSNLDQEKPGMTVPKPTTETPAKECIKS